MKSKKTAFLVFLVLSFLKLNAQSSTISGGGESISRSGSVSYSLGQVVNQTQTGTDGSIAEGVQQPYQIYIMHEISQAKINVSVSTYPNPVTNHLMLQVDLSELSNLSYKLYDVNGKILQNKKIKQSQLEITMDSYVPSLYFLKVLSKNKPLKTFKIIKK